MDQGAFWILILKEYTFCLFMEFPDEIIFFIVSLGFRREDNVYLAKLCEQAERYNEMVDSMKTVARLNVELTVEERNLLSVAFKNVAGAKRAEWRIISSIEQKEKSKTGCEEMTKKIHFVEKYIAKIHRELSDICNDVLCMIDCHLIKFAKSSESLVFYYKMKGDYNRYLAEISPCTERAKYSDACFSSYEEAYHIACSGLRPTSPIRLGLSLSFGCFYFEILNQPQKAFELQKKAFDDAIGDLDSLSEDSYKDSTVIMQLLRDGLTYWTSDDQDDTDELG